MTEQTIDALKVLIFEDQFETSEMLKGLIDRLPWKSGKETIVFDTAERGMAYLHAQSAIGPQALPHLIILDLELPDKHGIEVLGILKKDPALQHIPVVVNSKSKESEDLVRTYRQGAIAFLRKGKDEEAFQTLLGQLKMFGILKI